MATVKQIVKASTEFAEAQQLLQGLKDKKQALQAQLSEVQASIDALQLQTTSCLASLKTLVNE